MQMAVEAAHASRCAVAQRIGSRSEDQFSRKHAARFSASAVMMR
jgi:hypothetical protein